jgi:hypothetical protein
MRIIALHQTAARCHHGPPLVNASVGPTGRDDARIGRCLLQPRRNAPLEAIRTLPDGATFDEAIERLCFIAKKKRFLS